MTLPRLAAINKHWESVPPVSVSLATIASILGAKVGVKSTKAASKSKSEQMNELMELAPVFGGVNKEMPEWLRKAKTSRSGSAPT